MRRKKWKHELGMNISMASSSSSKRHPVYHGIRCRGGKWVSEIREPGKGSRIWLGTFPTPEMAATAYDVAALALKGDSAVLNHPHSLPHYQLPLTNSPADIRTAASAAAAMMKPQTTHNASSTNLPHLHNTNINTSTIVSNRASTSWLENDFIDEEAIFSMPSLLVDMAGGMLLSPPRMSPPPSYYSPEKQDEESLWSYF
ncbi:hypothetical protein VNO77_41242 [Canavalia gladiata]|uniref:AP2/ERF domain-containing protein n=1 Tax=Canavalia gladiata TaxID=3824 RepID=A0AAN9PSE9_CANGL